MYMQERPALELMDTLRGHSQIGGYGNAKVQYIERKGFVVTMHLNTSMTEKDFAFIVDMARKYQVSVEATAHDGTLRVQFGS